MAMPWGMYPHWQNAMGVRVTTGLHPALLLL